MDGTYGSNALKIKRALEYADMLRKQGQEPVAAGYLMPGGSGPLGPVPGRYIPESKWDMAGNVLKSAMGGYQANQAEQEQSALDTSAQQAAQSYGANIPELTGGPGDASALLHYGAQGDLSNPYLKPMADEMRGGGLKLALAASKGIGNEHAPMSVKEWEYFSKLPEKEKPAYLRLKRAQQFPNFGGSIGVADPVGGGIGSYIPKTMSPDAMSTAMTNYRNHLQNPDVVQSYLDQANGDPQGAQQLMERDLAAFEASLGAQQGSTPNGASPQLPPEMQVPPGQPAPPAGQGVVFGQPGTTATDIREGTTSDTILPAQNAENIPTGFREPIALDMKGFNAVLPSGPTALPKATGRTPVPVPVSPIAMKGREAEASAAGTVRGDTMAKATASLPALYSTLGTISKQIDEIKKMPGAQDIGKPTAAVGQMLTKTLGIGTETGNISKRLDQLKGGAMKVAYDSLRGTGSVATAEGDAATAAYLRADMATTPEEFFKAVDDFKANFAKHVKVIEEMAAGKVPALKGGHIQFVPDEEAEYQAYKKAHNGR